MRLKYVVLCCVYFTSWLGLFTILWLDPVPAREGAYAVLLAIAMFVSGYLMLIHWCLDYDRQNIGRTTLDDLK